MVAYTHNQYKVLILVHLLNERASYTITWYGRVRTRTHPSLLYSNKLLIGRHDRTAIIDRSRCCVEEMSFQEAVSDGEA